MEWDIVLPQTCFLYFWFVSEQSLSCFDISSFCQVDGPLAFAWRQPAAANCDLCRDLCCPGRCQGALRELQRLQLEPRSETAKHLVLRTSAHETAQPKPIPEPTGVCRWRSRATFRHEQTPASEWLDWALLERGALPAQREAPPSWKQPLTGALTFCNTCPSAQRAHRKGHRHQFLTLSISQPRRPSPATTLAIVAAELRQCLDRSPHRTGPMLRRATLDRSADRQPQQEMDLSLCSRSSMSSLRGVRLLPQHGSFVVRPPVRAVTRSTPVLQAMRFSQCCRVKLGTVWRAQARAAPNSLFAQVACGITSTKVP